MNITDILNALYITTYNDIRNYFFTNGLIINASGYTIGLTTYYFIKNILETFAPISDVFKIIIDKYEIKLLNKNNIIYYIIKSIIIIILNTITWLFTLFLTFIILEYFLNNLIIGLKSNIKKVEKEDYIKAKTNNKKLSLTENAEKIKIIDNKENILANKIEKIEESKLDNELMNQELYESNIDNIKNKYDNENTKKILNSII